MNDKNKNSIPAEKIGQKTEIAIIDERMLRDKIYEIRGVKVMLDFELAELYGYETKNFNRQVKNNVKKFEGDDFMFQLTRDELDEISRCKNFTSMQTKGVKGGRVYNPYAFTEQGIYMLMTVLKGELAVRQSKTLIRLFKKMKDFIVEKSNTYVELEDFSKLSLQTNENTQAIKRLEQELETRKDLYYFIENFTEKKDTLILNGQQVEADITYKNIYGKANDSIFIIDNYINLKTLVLLKDIKENIKVTIFTDNINKCLHKIEYEDFIKEYKNINITFKKANNKIHDRYIILDYNSEQEQIYLCGSSSKDSGNKITTITKIKDNNIFHNMIDNLLENKKLILTV